MEIACSVPLLLCCMAMKCAMRKYVSYWSSLSRRTEIASDRTLMVTLKDTCLIWDVQGCGAHSSWDTSNSVAPSNSWYYIVCLYIFYIVCVIDFYIVCVIDFYIVCVIDFYIVCVIDFYIVCVIKRLICTLLLAFKVFLPPTNGSVIILSVGIGLLFHPKIHHPNSCLV